MFKLNIRHRPTTILFLFFLSLWIVLFNKPARAELRCKTDGLTNIADIGNSDLVKISKSTPIGTIVFQKTISSLTVKCSSKSLTQKENLYFVRKNLTNLLGANSGLSVNVSFKGNNGESAANILVASDIGYSGESSMSTYWPEISFGPVTVEIVKTGQGTEISKSKKDVTIFTMDSVPTSGDGQPYFIRNVPNIEYVTETCKPLTNSVVVAIPDQGLKPGGFGSAIGSVSDSQKAFTLDFSCDVDVSGKFDVKLQIDGRTALPDTTKGVLLLDSSGAGDASGVGVQILNGTTNAPISLGIPWLIASYPATVSNALSVPLIARYYQTEDSVTPGKVSSSATFTLTYE